MPVRLSLVIPTRDRPALLGRALAAIARHVDPRHAADVLVVDNGREAGTEAAFQAAAAAHPRLPWRLVHEPVPGLLSGRHRGAAEARGDVLCYLDDDALVTATWSETVRDAFADGAARLVGGPSAPLFERRPPGWLRHLWAGVAGGGRMLDLLSLIDCGPEPRPVEPWFVWGLNFSIRRDALAECGGFHPDGVPPPLLRLRGDGEGGLAYKLAARGERALYHPGALVHHVLPASRITLPAVERRAFAQGVSDSYTAIRAAGAAPPPAPPAAPRRTALRHARARFFGSALALKELVADARAAGRAFHEAEVRRDPRLLAWVLRPDYFDYSLPEGAGVS